MHASSDRVCCFWCWRCCEYRIIIIPWGNKISLEWPLNVNGLWFRFMWWQRHAGVYSHIENRNLWDRISYCSPIFISSQVKHAARFNKKKGAIFKWGKLSVCHQNERFQWICFGRSLILQVFFSKSCRHRVDAAIDWVLSDTCFVKHKTKSFTLKCSTIFLEIYMVFLIFYQSPWEQTEAFVRMIRIGLQYLPEFDIVSYLDS